MAAEHRRNVPGCSGGRDDYEVLDCSQRIRARLWPVRRSTAHFVPHLVQHPIVQADVTAKFVGRLEDPYQWAQQYFDTVYSQESDQFGMPDPDYYSMNTLTELNLPWRRTVCGLHSISISIGYNRTCVHVCVRSEYGYDGTMAGAAAEHAPRGEVEPNSGPAP